MRQDGNTLSTVGIDINEIVIGEKWANGPVTFRTWDFGGQVRCLGFALGNKLASGKLEFC